MEKEIYAVADYYVNILNFDYYQDFNDSERKRRMNRAKACEIMQWGCKNLGLLKDDGFAVKLEIDIALLSKDMILTEDGLVQQIKAKEELS